MLLTLPDSYVSIMRPPPDITVSEWCDQNRMLSDKYGPERTMWETSRTPYLREPLDASADPSVGSIMLVKCSRVGGTEWLYNCIARNTAVAKMPTLVIFPTEPSVKEEMSGRILSIYKDSPTLKALAPNLSLEPPTIELNNNVTIYGAFASSEETLLRRTIGFVAFDELDNCESASGRLGNSLTLVSDRTTNFGYRAKILAATTPTNSEASGWKMYEASDRRRYFVPCPCCGHYQPLIFSGITLAAGREDERDPDVIEAESLGHYRCESCEKLIHQREQSWMVARGLWVPACQKIAEKLDVNDPDKVAAAALYEQGTGVIHGLPTSHHMWRPQLSGRPPITRNRGYWINSCYSPWRTWSQIIAKFLRVKDDPEKRRVFFNSWMAEPYEESVEQTDAETLSIRIPDGLPHDHVPSRAKILLCGADVQEDCLYYTIRAWGAREESWLIRHGNCTTFAELYDIAFRTGFPILDTETGEQHAEIGARMVCASLAIDSGHRTLEVYEFGKNPGVMVVKGRDNGDFRTKPSKVDYMPKGGIREDSLVLQHVNRFLYNTKLHRLMADPERWHLHLDTTLEYCKQMTAEKLKWKRKKGKKPRQVWESSSHGTPNHWFDCEAYALALADMLNVPLLRDEHQPRNVIIPPPPPDSRPLAPRLPPPPRKQFGWR